MQQKNRLRLLCGMFYSVCMATKTSIKVESDVWKSFQAYARAQGRSASKQMEWLMREVVEHEAAKGKIVADISSTTAHGVVQSKDGLKAIRKRSSG